MVLTIALCLYPPFTSIEGTEHAFVLSGPEWSQVMRSAGLEPGLGARIHWVALLVQLVAVWAIALGAWAILARPEGASESG